MKVNFLSAQTSNQADKLSELKFILYYIASSHGPLRGRDLSTWKTDAKDITKKTCHKKLNFLSAQSSNQADKLSELKFIPYFTGQLKL